MRNSRTLNIVLAGALALSIVPTTIGCGGGNSSIAAPVAPTRSIVVEGRALLNTITRAVSNAVIQGDSPIPNAPAELVVVSTDGTLGNTIATTTTDTNGFFSFGSVTVPSETTRFIIRVTAAGQTVSRFLPAPVSTTEPLRVDLSTTVATGYILEQILAAPTLLTTDLTNNMETYITTFDTLRANGTAAPVDPTLPAIDHTAAIAQLKGIVQPVTPTPVTPTPNNPTGSVEIITRGR